VHGGHDDAVGPFADDVEDVVAGACATGGSRAEASAQTRAIGDGRWGAVHEYD
jgi:hypothetical protein